MGISAFQAGKHILRLTAELAVLADHPEKQGAPAKWAVTRQISRS